MVVDGRHHPRWHIAEGGISLQYSSQIFSSPIVLGTPNEGHPIGILKRSVASEGGDHRQCL